LRPTLTYLVALILSISPAVASEKSDVISTVQKLIDDFNKADNAALAADMVDAPQIIDELPPFHWSGTNALSEWGHDIKIEVEKRSIAKFSVTLMKANYLDVRDNGAYVVIPAILHLTLRNGRHDQEKGRFVLALTKSDHWRTSSLAWSRE
jgi:hypothetical protein